MNNQRLINMVMRMGIRFGIKWLNQRSKQSAGKNCEDGGPNAPKQNSVDLNPGDSDLVGYRAKPHTGVVDLGQIDHYDPAEYWEEVRTRSGRIILDPGAFYILVSRESISIPPGYAAEMAPYIAMVGEFRVHYAGFFDPGFGHSMAGGSGARGVLEVRCHEAPFVLEHGQVVGRLVYERMAKVPAQLYGQDIKSNYQGQGLKLAKHFKSSK